MSLHDLSLKRMLGIGLACFAVNYVSGMLLYTFYKVTAHPLLFIFMFAAAPLTYLLFSWIYFRSAPDNDWTHRFLVAAVWIGMTLVGSAFLMAPVYGFPWHVAFAAGTLRGQLINASAILVAGWANRK